MGPRRQPLTHAAEPERGVLKRLQRLDEKLVLLHRAPNLATAELLRGVLVNEGIRVFLRAPRLSPFIGVDETDILVPSSEEKAAREVLEAFMEPGGDQP